MKTPATTIEYINCFASKALCSKSYTRFDSCVLIYETSCLNKFSSSIYVHDNTKNDTIYRERFIKKLKSKEGE